MRIAWVHIQHFRSIKESNFDRQPYCPLIDENNSETIEHQPGPGSHARRNEVWGMNRG